MIEFDLKIFWSVNNVKNKHDKFFSQKMNSGQIESKYFLKCKKTQLGQK